MEMFDMRTVQVFSGLLFVCCCFFEKSKSSKLPSYP